MTWRKMSGSRSEKTWLVAASTSARRISPRYLRRYEKRRSTTGYYWGAATPANVLSGFVAKRLGDSRCLNEATSTRAQSIEGPTGVVSPLCASDDRAKALVLELSLVGRLREHVPWSRPESLDSNW